MTKLNQDQAQELIRSSCHGCTFGDAALGRAQLNAEEKLDRIGNEMIYRRATAEGSSTCEKCEALFCVTVGNLDGVVYFDTNDGKSIQAYEGLPSVISCKVPGNMPERCSAFREKE